MKVLSGQSHKWLTGLSLGVRGGLINIYLDQDLLQHLFVALGNETDILRNSGDCA